MYYEPETKHELVSKIVCQLQNGENVEANFRRIFHFYHAPLERFFRRKNLSNNLAQDLTQETFVRVFNAIGGFRGEAPFEAWLWQIATNVFRSHRVKQQTLKRAAETISLDAPVNSDREKIDLPDTRAASPLAAVLNDEKREKLQTAIAELSPQQQKCVRLRAEQDLSYAEIAVVLQLSIETVKAHLFQARKHLKGKLRDYFAETDL